MVSTITSCQANALLSLQRSLSDQGFTLTVTEGEQLPSAPAVRKTGKRRGRPRKLATTDEAAAPAADAKAPPKKTMKRGMSAKGRSSIAASATIYHRQVKELRERDNLTLKQARAAYRKMKKEGVELV